jgi:hypothetical protein
VIDLPAQKKRAGEQGVINVGMFDVPPDLVRNRSGVRG